MSAPEGMDPDLAAALVAMADDVGSLSWLDLMIAREALASCRIDREDGTWAVGDAGAL